ncbi:hypothetical protein [Porticoccus sp.]
MRQTIVNGVRISYLDEGQGDVIIFYTAWESAAGTGPDRSIIFAITGG